MQKKIAQSAIAVTLAAMVSGGCASTRFSAPEVNLDYAVSSKTAGSSCANIKADKDIGISKADKGIGISEDFNGAMKLLDNFMVGYRCAAQSAAEGRTKFEVPTFLLATTAALGQSFGISEDWTLGLASGAAVIRQGNSYFAPQAKADYLNSAVDALTCIQLESVGIDGFDLSREPEEKKGSNPKTAAAGTNDSNDNNGTVTFPAEQQYFRMISGALLSVERVLARRLNHAGTPFDPAGILAEISMLTKEVEENKPDPNDPPPASGKDGDITMGMPPLGGQIAKKKQKLDDIIEKASKSPEDIVMIETLKNDLIILETKLLQPKLQKCIILAKI